MPSEYITAEHFTNPIQFFRFSLLRMFQAIIYCYVKSIALI